MCGNGLEMRYETLSEIDSNIGHDILSNTCIFWSDFRPGVGEGRIGINWVAWLRRLATKAREHKRVRAEWAALGKPAWQLDWHICHSWGCEMRKLSSRGWSWAFGNIGKNNKCIIVFFRLSCGGREQFPLPCLFARWWNEIRSTVVEETVQGMVYYVPEGAAHGGG